MFALKYSQRTYLIPKMSLCKVFDSFSNNIIESI